MDLKKEIKLSDLIPKRQKSGGGSSAPKVAAKKKKAKQDYVGIKVGASQIAAAQVQNNGGSKIVKLAREPLEPGVVVGGEVRDIAALGRALDEFFKKHDLPRKGVRLGIGTNRVGVRVLDVEGIDDEKQLANAVTFRAHEALSIPMDQAVMDYHVVGSHEVAGGGLSHRVILAAAYREPIDHFTAAFDAAEIQLDAIDVEAFALLRAVSPAVANSDGERTAVVALALGHDRTTLAISDGRFCDFTRVLEWGGSRLDAAIARELGMTTEEATEVKLGLSLLGDDAASARARNAVKHELTTLARELVASLQFYQAQPDSLALAEILVTGGTTRMPGFVEELERLVRARVRPADPLSAVHADANGRRQSSSARAQGEEQEAVDAC
jgi:type IV pilus assembly protein PilM